MTCAMCGSGLAKPAWWNSPIPHPMQHAYMHTHVPRYAMSVWLVDVLYLCLIITEGLCT
jgi:hypothetical protein